MKALKTETVVKAIESLGGELISSNGHKKYRIGAVSLMIPHHREVSPGVLRDLCRAAHRGGLNLKDALAKAA